MYSPTNQIMLKFLALGGLAALAAPGLARPMAPNHPAAASAADAGKQRHRREVSFCPIGCEHGSYRGWWDTVRRHCTCDRNWGSRCCTTYTGPCYTGNPALCAQSKLSQKSFAVIDLLEDGVYNGPLTLGTAADNLPPNMQGVFWLQGQAASSSIVSFGPSRDGDGLSVWNANSNRQISVRVGGDKVWSGASNGSTWELVEGIDLVCKDVDIAGHPEPASLPPLGDELPPLVLLPWHLLQFNLSKRALPTSGAHRVARSLARAQCGCPRSLADNFEGTPTVNPTHFNIIPEAMNLGAELSSDLAQWALSFQMDLLAVDDARHEYPATATRHAAVQWMRNSSFAGIHADSLYYEIAQIIDGAGMPTAAFDAWVAYNSGDEAWQDGTIYYRSA